MNTDEFKTMADEAYQQLTNTSGKILILPDLICDITPTRLHWKNIKDFLKVINRSPAHLINWLKSEMADKQIDLITNHVSDGIIIQGKYQKKNNLSTIALKYISIFVTCSSCNSVDTTMNKHQKLSYYEFECSHCGVTKNI